MSHTKHWYVVAALALSAGAVRADAQGFGDRLKRAASEAAKRNVERRVERTADAATEATLDGAEREVKAGARAATGGAAGAGAAPAGAAASSARAAGAPAPASAGATSESAAAGAAAPVRTNAGKDFTPGTRVLFASDFARDELGDFPRALRLRSGNAEVADVGGTRYLRMTSFGEFEVPLPETLPDRFTAEFDFTGAGGWYQQLFFVPKDRQDAAVHVSLRPSDGGLAGPDNYDVSADAPGAREGVPFRVQIMADGEYVKVYMNGTRVANAPNAALGRSRALRFVVRADGDHPALIGNVRVAAGGKDLYAALAASGRVTADGVLFDTNSDRLRPESAPVLGEIARMLAAHPELRLSIEGHTDDVGGAAANLALSQKRAEAVRAALVARYGVAADRLAAKGFGASKPVTSNGGEAGRQRNRRVELVRG